jgi:hypothetical protein
MLHDFLATHRKELIERCKTKVAARAQRAQTEEQLANGVPIFLDQLTRTLRAEDVGDGGASSQISGSSGGDAQALSEIGMTATAHGSTLLSLGYSVDQVVHDYGDLCQAITDLAAERDAPFAVSEFRTLNRCLDNAIADAVLEFSSQRDAQMLARQSDEVRERVGFLVHELRNALSTARLAFSALELGNMPVGGATGAVLKRCHASLDMLITRAVAEVRNGMHNERQVFPVEAFIADAEAAARLSATQLGVSLGVLPVDPGLHIRGNRGLLLAALANLLQNAFKFTHAHSEVILQTSSEGNQVFISVADHCGGLLTGSLGSKSKPGLGFGLAIARTSVEADFGTLSVRDIPGTGCVFTIAMPLHLVETGAVAVPPCASTASPGNEGLCSHHGPETSMLKAVST